MELLSPAGGMLQGKSAIISGADAIYLGAKEFSARSGAANFDYQELKKMVDFCHLRGKDVHLTVNTLLSDSELQKLDELIIYAREIGVDAFIIQDLGVIRRVKSIAPDVPIHGSTQMSVCNLEGVRIAEKLGLSRIVLARELSIQEIREISKNTHLETEIFVHGAICVSYSGQCLLSSMVGGRSGNRGNCAQPCRKLYFAGKKEGYFLSPGDMCLLEHLEEIKDAGVASLKIEGRMKSPEYVSTVTGIYRKYLNSGDKVSEEDIQILKNAFCRGEEFTDGYFTGKIGPEMMRPATSNDNIYSRQDKKLLLESSNVYKEGKEGEKIGIYGSFEGKTGSVPTFSVWDEEGNSVTSVGNQKIETPLKEPLTEDRIIEQLNKLGNTPYRWESLSVSWDNGFTMIREINELRRSALLELSEVRLERRRRKPLLLNATSKKGAIEQKGFSLDASVERKEQAEALFDTEIERIYVPFSLYPEIKETSKKIIPYLPSITSTEENNGFIRAIKESGADTLLCTNIGHIDVALQAGVVPYCGFQLNLFNSFSLETVKELGVEEAVLSVELNQPQMKHIYKNRPMPLSAIIYGKLPLMTTKNCLIKTAGGGECSCDTPTILKDRNGTVVSLQKGEECKTVIYNSQPIYLADKMDGVKECVDRGILFFTDETPQTCKKITNDYLGKQEYELPASFTRGHFVHGV